MTICTVDLLFALKLVQNIHLKINWSLQSPKKGLRKVSFMSSLIKPQIESKHPTELIFKEIGWFCMFLWKIGLQRVSVRTLQTLAFRVQLYLPDCLCCFSCHLHLHLFGENPLWSFWTWTVCDCMHDMLWLWKNQDPYCYWT